MNRRVLARHLYPWTVAVVCAGVSGLYIHYLRPDTRMPLVPVLLTFFLVLGTASAAGRNR